VSEFWVITSGRSMLPEGHRVGYIEAKDANAAQTALIRSGQIPPR
jgi:hypothetical protein